MTNALETTSLAHRELPATLHQADLTARPQILTRGADASGFWQWRRLIHASCPDRRPHSLGSRARTACPRALARRADTSSLARFGRLELRGDNGLPRARTPAGPACEPFRAGRSAGGARPAGRGSAQRGRRPVDAFRQRGVSALHVLVPAPVPASTPIYCAASCCRLDCGSSRCSNTSVTRCRITCTG